MVPQRKSGVLLIEAREMELAKATSVSIPINLSISVSQSLKEVILQKTSELTNTFASGF